ncbi:endolytic transglycosylase MltG [Paenibacillus sp. IB182496]|uniref:Endolytic murein transglycosylase n=2 Tax=Paenibacillus sabuli TaxID=2772509 RepID=A0A927BPW5_9BACL|nr:endolytic transglycosylase MltG [Paenibacillus sabuli]
MALAVGGAAFYVWNGLRPAPAGPPVTFEIASGTSPYRVADHLEREGIIRNAFLFKYYVRLTEEGARFQAGTYELAPGMGRDAIIAKLNSGDTIAPNTVRFTIPEGFTVTQIADKLAAEGVVDRAKFVELANNPTLLAHSESALKIPKDEANLQFLLEGYLFPETYEIEVDSTVQDVIVRMLHELDRKLEQLPEGWGDTLAERGLSFHEMMTIASLIEREVVVDEERALVSGVIRNRLDDNMPLQIDASVQYALETPKERLLEADLEVDSPYNTYQVQGLPPGPIASPSYASIEAAIYPEATDYLFYVTKKDGSQTHLFAETYNGHLRNIEESNRNTGGE